MLNNRPPRRRPRKSSKKGSQPGLALKALALLVALVAFYLSPANPLDQAQNTPQPAQQNGTTIARKGDVYTATVVRVPDGDTVTVRDTNGQQRRVRLHAIDAPESQQAHGKAAGQWLASQVEGRPIKVHVVTVDRYQREVGYLLLPGEDCGLPRCPGDIDLNLQAVQLGHAWWYREFARQQTPEDRSQYEAAEASAQQARVGLWARPNPQAPWEWRAMQRKQ